MFITGGRVSLSCSANSHDTVAVGSFEVLASASLIIASEKPISLSLSRNDAFSDAVGAAGDVEPKMPRGRNFEIVSGDVRSDTPLPRSESSRLGSPFAIPLFRPANNAFIQT